MSSDLSPKDFVCYCGLYCKLCATMAVYPPQAKVLAKSMGEDGWEAFGECVFEGFNTFWKVLGQIANLDDNTQLCKGGCGDPECKIRQCAIEKHVRVCGLCEEYPCVLISNFSLKYPILLKINGHLRKVGFDQWLTDMEILAARGVTFRDAIAFD